MAAPNLVNVSSIYGKTMGAALTTSNVAHITCAAEKVLKVNSIIVANVDGTNAADVTVRFKDGTTSFRLANTVTVPADSTLIVLGKDAPIYLEETHQIEAWASAAGDLEIIISYEELDDA